MKDDANDDAAGRRCQRPRPTQPGTGNRLRIGRVVAPFRVEVVAVFSCEGDKRKMRIFFGVGGNVGGGVVCFGSNQVTYFRCHILSDR